MARDMAEGIHRAPSFLVLLSLQTGGANRKNREAVPRQSDAKNRRTRGRRELCATKPTAKNGRHKAAPTTSLVAEGDDGSTPTKNAGASGHGNASSRCGLFIAKSDHGIDAHGAAGGNVAGRERHDAKQNHHSRKSCQICGLNFKEQTDH